MLGVLTKDTSNFTPYKIYNVEQAYFVEILTMHALEAGNWSFSLSLSVTAVKGESSWFNIPIPSTVGILFLGVAIVGLAYPNAYLFTDLYYRSKKEEVSKKRKVGKVSFYYCWVDFLFVKRWAFAICSLCSTS
jgi:hypothetical protein